MLQPKKMFGRTRDMLKIKLLGISMRMKGM
jgi:hypothetical protein